MRRIPRSATRSGFSERRSPPPNRTQSKSRENARVFGDAFCARKMLYVRSAHWVQFRAPMRLEQSCIPKNTRTACCASSRDPLVKMSISLPHTSPTSASSSSNPYRHRSRQNLFLILTTSGSSEHLRIESIGRAKDRTAALAKALNDSKR